MTSPAVLTSTPVAAASSVPGSVSPTAARLVEAPAAPPVDWDAEIQAVIADPDRLQLVFQPIVDLRRAVIAGYETLSRFMDADGGRSAVTPDVWFAAADERGRGAELEALVVERVLAMLPTLPANCFLTVNVSPHLLTEPALADLLLRQPQLDRLVLELTEHQTVSDLRPLIELRDVLLSRGALLALDDAGSGYSGLQQMTQFRPQIIKLDRALVADADKDEVKLALAELLGAFGERIDAWLLAEGVETWGELNAFLRLGVPLGQGYLLGRPAPAWSELDPELVRRLREQGRRAELVENVVSLVDTVRVLGPDAPSTELPFGETGIRVDPHGHPTALLLPTRRGEDGPGHREAPVSLRVPGAAGVVEVARRVVSRPEASRFDPVVCVDTIGVAVGIIRVERLLIRLTEQHTA